MNKQSGIFFVRNEEGATRITRTNDLSKRLSEWRAASPSALKVVGMVTTDTRRQPLTAWHRSRVEVPIDASEEQLWEALHRYFKPQCIHGEWYSLDEATILEMPVQHPRVKSALAELISKSEIVWKAIEYAQSKVPSRWEFQFQGSGCDNKRRETALWKHVVEWLTTRGKNDISVVLQFDHQYQMLEDIAYNAGGDLFGDGMFHTYGFIAWLVLQGEAIFASFVENPSLRELMNGQDDYEAYFVMNAFSDIVLTGQWDGLEYLYEFNKRLQAGAQIEDFKGWNGQRVADEFDNCA